MKETRFIEQNRKKWEELEQQLNQSTKDPDRLSDLFIQVADDLSYSRTFYKNRVVRVYLNQLTQRVFGSLYRNTLNQKKKFVFFWKQDLPEILYLSRKELRLSLVIFLLSMALGVVSSIYDPNFCASILGDGYIQMTQSNIKNGDPMAVYKDGNSVDMFLGITTNNLMVAYRTFIFGLFAAVGTIGIMVYNGIMVGVFQYFFVERGLFIESALTIWMHGTLEISAIIIAGGAGLVMGKGIVLPGTYTRMQALRISARSAIKIMIGISPIFIVAGIIESFITRLTELNDIIRFIIILSELVLILAYFFWLPRRIGKKGIPFRLNDSRIPETKRFEFSFETIKNAGVIFGESFTVFNQIIGKLIVPILAISLAFCFAQLYFINPEEDYISGLIGNLPMSGLKQFPLIYLYYVTAFTALTSIVGYYWRKNKQLNPTETAFSKNSFAGKIVATWILSSIFFSLMIPDYIGTVLLFFIFPLLLFLVIGIQLTHLHPVEALKKTWQLLFISPLNLYGFYIAMAFIGYLWMLLMNRAALLLNFSMLEWFIKTDDSNYMWLRGLIGLLPNAAGILFFIPILLCGFAIHYYSVIEVKEAKGLASKLDAHQLTIIK